MQTPPKFAPSARIAAFKQDVWSIFSPLAAHCQAVNLGQGFPNFRTAPFVKEAACQAIHGDVNQYAPPKGLLRLRQALAAEYGPLMRDGGAELSPDTEMIVTAGANEGFYAVMQAFLNDGDEVVCLEPFFDQYAPNITMSGGVMKLCPLRPPPDSHTRSVGASEWTVDIAELEALITNRTKILVINTPHNPVGKVFTRTELEQLAEVAIRHNLIVVSDEVYERLVYGDAQHVRIASLPGMWDRTVTVASAGKSFCVTGWRVGWLIGAAPLIHRALIAHSRIVFCTNAPLQEAIAISLEQTAAGNKFFEEQLDEYARKRLFMLGVFQDLGIPITIPDGSYFILASIQGLHVSEEELAESEPVEAKFCLDGVVPPRSRDWKICRWLTVNIGVAAIPPSEFYGREHAHLAEGYARFCFCKTDETLQAAAAKLQLLRPFLKVNAGTQ